MKCRPRRSEYTIETVAESEVEERNRGLGVAIIMETSYIDMLK